MPDIRTIIQGWRWQAKGLGRELGMLSGSTASFLKKARGQRILVYHGICKNDHLRYNTLFVTERIFEKHLQLYKRYCQLLSLSEYFEGKFSNDRYNLCLTFDDGFANNHQYVLPLLEKYEVPAAFFITGIRKAGLDILWNDMLAIARYHGPAAISYQMERFIKDRSGVYVSGTGERLNDILRRADFDTKLEVLEQLQHCKTNANTDFWLQLTQEEIQEMATSKWVTIGSHGFYHNDLAALPEEMVMKELVNTKEYLQQLTGKEIRSLAFPYGAYSATTIDLAKQAGYTQLFAGDFVQAGDSAETTLRERFTINPFISPVNQLYANMKGNYD